MMNPECTRCKRTAEQAVSAGVKLRKRRVEGEWECDPRCNKKEEVKSMEDEISKVKKLLARRDYLNSQLNNISMLGKSACITSRHGLVIDLTSDLFSSISDTLGVKHRAELDVIDKHIYCMSAMVDACKFEVESKRK